MTEVIIAAIIAAAGSVLGSYFINNKNQAVLEERMTDLKDDIKTLSNRVDKHNNLVERMVVVEQSTKSAHKRIDEVMHNS